MEAQARRHPRVVTAPRDAALPALGGDLSGSVDADAALLALVADRARRVEARSRLRDQLDASSRGTVYLQWLERLPWGDVVPRRVALLSSFTVRTLEPFLRVEAWLSGWEAELDWVEYAPWRNALIAPDGLPEGKQAVVLLLHDTELLRESAPDPAAALSHLQQLLATFRSRCATPLFVGLVQAPPPLGLPGPEDPLDLAREALRRGLREIMRAVPDVHRLPLPAPGPAFDRSAFIARLSVFGGRAQAEAARAIARSLACLFRSRRKLLVLDADNTLWGGVVGEDGVDGLAIGTGWPGAAYLALQRQALRLRDQGVLLALASKNNEADAREVFERRPEMLLRWEHFSARRVDWNDKAANIDLMATELGLGLDSVVFADDSGIECARVREALPQVEVVELGRDPARYVEQLLRCQAFDALVVTDEDRQRAAAYAAEGERSALASAATDMAAFLASCELRLAIDPLAPATLDRVHQLLGKTNQFNFTLERHAKETLQRWCIEGTRVFTATLADRFGDYGLIGIVHLEPEAKALRLANMALSCRALGRGVEDALLAFARERAKALGLTRLVVQAVRGPRNQQVFDFLARSGFAAGGEAQGSVPYELPLAGDVLPWPSFLTVQSPA
jgi:FkbH-like protein